MLLEREADVENEKLGLHLKYRPSTLDEMMGNETAKKAILDAFNKTPIPKVYLISGPAGCGKTSLAYIIGNMLGCHSSAFHEFDASTDRGIDKLRKIKSDAQLHPMMGNVVVLFFDECHQITGPAQESMLKMLEVPPPHVYCILATTEPTKLKKTVLRRCHKIPVEYLTRGDTVALLKKVVAEEGRDWMSPKLFTAIFKTTLGSPGESVQLLDQVITLCDMEAKPEVRKEKELEAITLIESVTFSQGFVIDLCRALSKRGIPWKTKWSNCQELLKNFTGNAESARLGILGYYEKILLNEDEPDPVISQIMQTFNESMIYSGRSGLTLATWISIMDYKASEERKRKDKHG